MLSSFFFRISFYCFLQYFFSVKLVITQFYTLIYQVNKKISLIPNPNAPDWIIIKFTISIYAPPNAPSLITSIGNLFVPKFFYKTPLSLNTELFSLLTASSLLIPHKIHLRLTPITFNIAMFLTHEQSSKYYEIYYKHLVQI